MKFNQVRQLAHQGSEIYDGDQSELRQMRAFFLNLQIDFLLKNLCINQGQAFKEFSLFILNNSFVFLALLSVQYAPLQLVHQKENRVIDTNSIYF